MFREPSGRDQKEGGQERAVVGGQWVEERFATSTSIWKNRFFLSLQQSVKANVSMLCGHAWLCCSRHYHLALLAQPPSMGCSDTVEPLPRAEEIIAALKFVYKQACAQTPSAHPVFTTQKKQVSIILLHCAECHDAHKTMPVVKCIIYEANL